MRALNMAPRFEARILPLQSSSVYGMRCEQVRVEATYSSSDSSSPDGKLTSSSSSSAFLLREDIPFNSILCENINWMDVVRRLMG